MKKFWFQIIALLIIIFGALYLFKKDVNLPGFQILAPFSSPLATAIPSEISTNKIQILDSTSTNELKVVKALVDVEAADTKEKRAKGLGGRESLASDSGMLFTFDAADKYQFWMKGMKIPLDFIWINDSRVVDVLEDVHPPSGNQSDDNLPRYGPTVSINKVLEVNSGFVDTYGIRIGDKIEFVSTEQSN